MYNQDGFYIENSKKWEYYKSNPKAYKIKKIKGFLCLLIPVCGVVFMTLVFEEMGLSIF